MDQHPCLNPVANPHFPVSTFSHRGLVRDNNEDSCLVKAFQANSPPHQNILLVVLADGVGGHQAGEIASRIAVETVAASIANCRDLGKPEALLTEAFQAANRQIVRQALVHEEWSGMGSTCVCALIIDDRLHVANLGDSRLYLIRDQKIQQLTYDHTWMEEISALDLPEMKKIDRSHPLAHVLNRYLGTSEPIQVDLRMHLEDPMKETGLPDKSGMTLQPGDIIALTSDGISDLLVNEEIKENLTCGNWEKSARRLIFNALQKGGYDNATVAAIQVPTWD